MPQMKRLSLIAATLMSLLVACSPVVPAPTTTPLPITPMFFPTDTPTPVPTPIYLNLIWNFHQPLYATDRQTGLVTSPWVRINATRFYYNTARLLQRYPGIHSVVNLSSLLTKQLADIQSGARDTHWEISTRSSDSLSDSDRQFMLTYFFDNSGPSISRTSPRYLELLRKRGADDASSIETAITSFTQQDMLDLQVWFNLATFSSAALSSPPLLDLVQKDRDFTEEDKQTVLETILAELHDIVPLYGQLQKSAQVELTTSPYAEPILPLLLDTDIATASGSGKDAGQNPKFGSTVDVDEQLKRSATAYGQNFGQPPRGMMLPDGAIAQNTVQPLVSAGIEWTATGQNVLSKTDRAGTLSADALHRPYAIPAEEGKQLMVVFNNTSLSDRFLTYASMTPTAAADNFVSGIHDIKAELVKEKATGPHLVTVVLEGESVLQQFDDSGQAFMETFYKRLSEAADQYDIQTVTPSDYIKQFANTRKLNQIAAGTWGAAPTPDLNAWIGTAEQNAVWANLALSREFLNDYLIGLKTTDKSALARAYDALLLAEGSAWLQPRTRREGAESTFDDKTYRELLGQVYIAVGVPLPDYLQMPMQPPSVFTSTVTTFTAISPTIDGSDSAGEWDGASIIQVGKTVAEGSQVIQKLYFGANTENLFFRLDATTDWSLVAASVDAEQPMRVGIYLAKPDTYAYSDFTRLGGDGELRTALGMSATHLLEWTLDGDGRSFTALYPANNAHGWAGTASVLAPGAATGRILEMSAPRNTLGGLTDLSTLNLVVFVSRGKQLISAYPINGLAQVTIPSTGKAVTNQGDILATFNDPVRDDFGPGAYTYPLNPVFEPGSFDIKRMTISVKDKNIVFMIELNGPINNVWNSPVGLSIQTFDIYIDKDPGKSTGERMLLDGRNAALSKGNGWEYAIWVEGWDQQISSLDSKGKSVRKSDAQITVAVDPVGIATVSVPLSELGDGNPDSWGYALTVLGQEAFPSTGVLRVRDVDQNGSEWHFGGASDDPRHSRIIDYLDPADSAPKRANDLGHYPPSEEKDVTKWTADDYGTIPLITISK